MRTEYYEKTHKWRKGFKAELCKFYNKRNEEIFGYKGHKATYRCAICGSTQSICIHHHRMHRRIYATYIDPETEEVDFSDFSKYIPLCQSCHGNIHAMHEGVGYKGASPLLQFLWQYMELVHGDNGYWNREGGERIEIQI